ncbi:MAG TPA: vWA domain-containing protein, partial [Phototrophicaceae bacterium]|nr:vWA domain-containing protein [Phototrophicaceae bacterium]
AISLICDVSGSMQGAKFNAVIDTVEDVLRFAPNGIMLNVVVFDSAGHEVLPMTLLEPRLNRNQLVDYFRQAMRRLSVFGGTSMSLGIQKALQAQAAVAGNIARYGIFLTDGQNTEPEAQLVAAVQAAANAQMHLCAYGYGQDWSPEQLTKLAQMTQGWMPKAVPSDADLRAEFGALVARMAKTVASDVVLQLWTPAGANILSLSQAYPEWVKGEAAPQGDGHTWVVPVPPMTTKEHRDFVVHVELASVGARVVACKPAVVYVAGGQRIEEKGDQATWMILEQTHEAAKFQQIHPVVAGYLGQGQLAAATQSMTEALAAGDAVAAERHRTEALEIAQAVGNRAMTEVLDAAGKGSEIARKTAALGTSTVSLTEEA